MAQNKRLKIKGTRQMANPSLKAQIEAARSALASSKSTSLLTTEKNQTDSKPTTERTSSQISPQEQVPTLASKNERNTDKIIFESGAAKINARITNLESKLLTSQQDLHELLTKVRLITDIQSDIKQTSIKPKNTTLGSKFRRYPTAITISLFIFICVSCGFVFFLPIKQSLLQLTIWIRQIYYLTSIWIG